jgi:hypothetical protein
MSLHRDHPGISRPPDSADRAAQAAGELSEQRARELASHFAATHADRETHQWLPRRSENGWQIVKIALKPPESNLTAETRAAERPDVADDPRSAHYRNAGPYAGT